MEIQARYFKDAQSWSLIMQYRLYELIIPEDIDETDDIMLGGYC